MKTISKPVKSRKKDSKPSAGYLTPAQVVRAEAILAELDAVFGGRNTGSVEFLLKMRRGEL